MILDIALGILLAFAGMFAFFTLASIGIVFRAIWVMSDIKPTPWNWWKRRQDKKKWEKAIREREENYWR